MSDTATIERPALTRQIERALDCTVKVARLYKKHGQPPVFHATKTVYNPPRQRVRLAASAFSPARYVCGRCGLLFVAFTNERCQCKVRTKKP